MASTLPEALLPEASAVREIRIAKLTDALCLQHLLAAGRQSWMLLPHSLLMTYLAAREGEVFWACVWFLGWVAREIYAIRVTRRLQAGGVESTQAGLDEVVRGYFLVGLGVAALLPVFFFRSSDTILLIVMVLLTIYAAAALQAVSGVLKAWLAFLLPLKTVVLIGWIWHGGFGWVAAAFLIVSIPVGIAVVRTQRQSLATLVRVMDDNATLSKALAQERDNAQAERDRAEAANASKTRFFAAASHDLRQPLHALSINATTLELVARRSGDALLNEISRGIGSALRQSSGLLDGLLDISRLDAQAVKLRVAAHPVGGLLAAVRDEYAALASQRGLALVVAVDAPQGSDELWVMTDLDQLLRILGNLVDNALKFTTSGSITLSAHSVGVVDGGAGQVQVRVTDTGPGISKPEQERVFEEFYQIGNPSRDRAQGLGLGLAIVKRTAKLLGIGIELVSEPGSGTSFVLSLPGANPVVAQCSDIETTPREDCNLRGSTTSRSVLLIDDESEVRSSLCTYLNHIGWSAQGAAGGAEAVQVLRQGFSPAILIVDFRLRDETGLDVIRRLQSYCPQVPALVVTGDTASQTLLESSGLVAGVLHKPVDGDALLRTMTQVLGPVRPPG